MEETLFGACWLPRVWSVNAVSFPSHSLWPVVGQGRSSATSRVLGGQGTWTVDPLGPGSSTFGAGEQRTDLCVLVQGCAHRSIGQAVSV